MKQVAIVGFYDPTLPAAKDTPAEEIWFPNHGYMVMSKDLPKITRMFEIHKQDWFLRKELPAYAQYWEFLQQEHDFPIYLQKAIPEVPNGIVYPFDEVCEDLFPHLLRQDPSGQLIRDTYLTSSAAFMLALAIHEKFDRVWIYGIGMETETEYGYQLPGFTYMIGLANGRGIDVVNQWNSPICKQEVYAYNAIPYMSLARLRELKEIYQARHKEIADLSAQLISDFNAGRTTNGSEVQNAADLKAVYFGANELLKALIDEGSQFMSRQALEVKRRMFANQVDILKAKVNDAVGRYQHKPTIELWTQYLNGKATMHATDGAVQLLSNLIRECDLRKVSHELVLAIKDIE